MKYHKIQSVFKRDPETKFKTFLPDFAEPEFEYLFYNEWVWTEKIDGTNIRIYYEPHSYEVGSGETIPDLIRIEGRTDKAQIPPNLLKALQREGDKIAGAGLNRQSMVFYGEGYGAGIQKGGGNYREDQGFVLFDIMIGERFVSRDVVESIARAVGLEVVPVLGHFSIEDALRYCKRGFNSNWGDFRAEGLIGVPRLPLVTSRGKRIITKIKCGDFDHD